MGERESQPGLALLRDAGTPHRQCPFPGAKSRGFKWALEDEPAIKLAVQLELSPGKAFRSSFPRVSPLRFAGREVPEQGHDVWHPSPSSIPLSGTGGWQKGFCRNSKQVFWGVSRLQAFGAASLKESRGRSSQRAEQSSLRWEEPRRPTLDPSRRQVGPS